MASTSHQPLPSQDISPLFYSGYKLSECSQVEFWQLLQSDPQVTTSIFQRCLFIEKDRQKVSIRHLNRIRKKWGISRKPGRPCANNLISKEPAEVIHFQPNISSVGIHIFDIWLESQSLWEKIGDCLLAQIKEYRQQFPDQDFPLLHHSKETLIKRFQALFFAPLLGIKRLSEYDRHEHALKSIIGRGYQSSTLNQCLGQLDRINAGEALIPALTINGLGRLSYIDGHMIAYWGKQSMHKGKITMLGRIMPGSQAVVTHSENGQASFVDYFQPDIHLTQVIVDYCQRAVAQTGSALFIIDRAINSVAVATEFDQHKMGLLSMLNDSDHKGLESFISNLIHTQQDGTKFYSAVWKKEKPNDPRQFVITEPVDGKILVYWGTKLFCDEVNKKDWPDVYRSRNHLQENSFKSMINHGALNVNYGHKKIIVPDRHQQRKRDVLVVKSHNNKIKLEKKSALIEQKQVQVTESEEKKHVKRLQQRQIKLNKLQLEQIKLQNNKQKVAENLEKLGKPRNRADRDLTKQLIMTFRTLILENMLSSFQAVLLPLMSLPISLELILSLFFDRSGACIEKSGSLIYYINDQGLSAKNKQLLSEIIQAVNTMDLKSKGKSVQVKIRGKPI